MYGKYKKRSSRAGFQKVKLICSINVTQLIIANSSSIQPGSVLSICFEKGGKISTSNEIIFDTNKNDINPLRTNVNMKYVTIPIDERVELVMTMYKDTTTNRFQEKVAKLILRQLKRHAGLGMDAFKGIGACELQLHELVQDVETSRSATKECTLLLENLPGCSMSALINIKFLKTRAGMFGMRSSIGGMSTAGNAGEDGESADDGEDNVSVGSTVSGGSAFSTLGATFYYNDLEEYYGAGEGIVGLSGAVHSGTGGSDSYTFGKTRSFDPDHDAEGASTGMGGVAGAQRRRSGVHVVEAAHQAERKPIKPLSRRHSSMGALGASRSSQALFGSSGNLTDANMTETSLPSSPTPEQQRTDGSRTSRTPSVAIPSRPTDGEWTEENGRTGTEWESVTTTERDRTSLHSSPAKLSPKSTHRKVSNASSPGGHNHHAHALLTTQANTTTTAALSAHSPYNNQETFALLEKELQARGERIAVLEARLAQQEQDHRAEMLVVKSELHAAQAEVRILSAIPPPPPPLLTPPLSPQPHAAEKVAEQVMEQVVVHEVQEESIVHAPFLCTRCKRTEEEVQQEEEQLAVSDKVDVPLDAHLPVPAPVPVQDAERSSDAHLIADQEREGELQQEQQQEQTAYTEELVTDSPPVTAEEDKEVVEKTSDNNEEMHVEEIPVNEDEKSTGREETKESEDENTTDPAPMQALVEEVGTVHVLDDVSVTHTAAEENTKPITLNLSLAPTTIASATSEPTPATSAHTQTTTTSTETQTTPDTTSTGTSTSTDTNTNTDTTTEPERAPSREVPTAAIAALLSEYGRSSAQVQLLAQDLVYYKQLAEDALRAKAEETLASREAATVAVHACMRRADCEQELEESIYQLRELQRKHSRLTIEYDAEVRRNYALKARLQLYAQKLSAMEVDYTLSLEETADL